jgi:CubicO group peptidase (beta-lactamase class C family)
MITRREFFLRGGSPLLASLLLPTRFFGDDLSDKFPEILNVLRQRTRLPAIAAVITTRDQIVAQGESGRNRIDQQTAVSPSAHWQLGSITKTFTATLTAILVEKGKLDWDTKLSGIYPEFVSRMAPNVGQITIRNIIEHRSGMGGDVFPWEGAPEFNQPGLTLSQRRQRSVPLALGAPLDFEPGNRYQYSNRAYNLLGACLERVARRSWEDLIVNEIATPLDIRSVVFGEPAMADPNREPWPHLLERNRWKPVAPVPLTKYGYHVCNPAGGISLTLEGVARWMQAHLNGEQKPGVLSTEMFKTIHTTESQGGVPALGVSAKSPALGRSLSHNGSNSRNFANMMILPDKGIGVFFATNAVPSEKTPAQWLIWNTLLSLALPGNWPRPALKPPAPNSRGVIEGEALEVVQMTGGSVDFQNFKQLSRQFQIWWSGAKDKNKLVLRFQVPRAGNYSLEGIFAHNRDFGKVTIKVGALERSLNFHADKLGWDRVSLGECQLDAGPQNITVIAQGSAGQNGVACHLGLDTLSLRLVE